MCLAEVAVEARRGGGHHHPAILLLAHDRPGGQERFHRAHQVHLDHRLEVGELHLAEGLVAQDAGVGDQDVQPAEGVDRAFHQIGRARVIGHRAAVGDRLAARRLDLGHHGVGRGRGAARAIQRRAQIVDHHLGAPSGQLQRVLAAQAPARSGDDGDLAVETDIGHWRAPFVLGVSEAAGERPSSSRNPTNA